MHRRVLATLILLFTFVCSLNAQDEDWFWNKTISKVEFEGLKNVSKSDLTAVTNDYIGYPLNSDTYEDILNSIDMLDCFLDYTSYAKPDENNENNVILVFEVVEKKTIKEINFNGNSKIRNGELRDLIKSKIGKIYSNSKVRMDERLIRDHYIEKGYSDSKISHNIVEEEDGVIINFNIVEGINTVVKEYHIVGNSVFSEKSIISKLTLKTEGFWEDGSFQTSALEMDKQLIINMYQQAGYIDAQILDVKIETKDNQEKQRQELYISIVVQEGSLYTFAGVTVSGNKVFSTEELLKGFKLKPGDIFNSVKYQEGLSQLQACYIDNGYMMVRIDPRPNKNIETKEISYDINIIEGEIGHVEHIIIKGNSKTKEEVIRREIPIQEGDVISRDKIISALRNLYNLQFFSNVVPDIKQGSEMNLYDIIFSVEETNTISLNAGMAITEITNPNDIPISLNFQLTNQNLFGEGKSLSVTTNLAKTEQSLSFTYGQNWINGKPISYNQSISFGHKDTYTQQNMFLPNLSLDQYYYYMGYEGFEASIGTAFGRRWYPNFAIVSVMGGMNNSLTKYSYDESVNVPTDMGISRYENRLGISNSLYAAVSLDNRDISYDPTKGWFASQRISWFGLIPGLEKEFFLKTETKLEGYYTLFDFPITDDFNFKCVLAAYTGFSYIFTVGNSVLSDSNRLFIDGMLIGRGWTDLARTVINKGQALWNTQIELRIPIVPNVVGFDLFHDAVAIKSSCSDMLSNLSLKDFYFSFGPAIRLLIPQFPLHIMFAFRYQYTDNGFKWADNPYQFVISFNIANR